MAEIFSVCEDTNTRLMLWTMWRSYIIKKLDSETETEEYMVPIVSNIYGKYVKCSNCRNLRCQKTDTDTVTGKLSRIAPG